MLPSELTGSAGRLRNVGETLSVARNVSMSSVTKSGPASSGSSNSWRPPTCIGCSRDSASRNIESVGGMNDMRGTSLIGAGGPLR